MIAFGSRSDCVPLGAGERQSKRTGAKDRHTHRAVQNNSGLPRVDTHDRHLVYEACGAR